MTEKKPRFYYQDIIKLKTKAERRAALEEVPEHCRALVRDLVISFFHVHGRRVRKTPSQ